LYINASQFFFSFVLFFVCAAILGRGYPSIHDLDEQSTLRCSCGIQFGACRRCISGHDLWFLFYSLGMRGLRCTGSGPGKVVVVLYKECGGFCLRLKGWDFGLCLGLAWGKGCFSFLKKRIESVICPL
jgi:hypothetical protein